MGHKGLCKNLHGHTYKMEVKIEGDLIKYGSSNGMVIDFGDLKEILMQEIDEVYDHSFTIWKEDYFIDMFKSWKDFEGQKINVVDFVPTAEN